MIDNLLLDTHVLLWLHARSSLDEDAQRRINLAVSNRRLFISDISLWELGVAVQKKTFERRPNLQGLSAEEWFQKAVKLRAIRTLRISARIAAEAARVPAIYGSGDPGDCFLIATARMRGMTLATRDDKIIKLAKREPDYLRVLPC